MYKINTIADALFNILTTSHLLDVLFFLCLIKQIILFYFLTLAFETHFHSKTHLKHRFEWRKIKLMLLRYTKTWLIYTLITSGCSCASLHLPMVSSWTPSSLWFTFLWIDAGGLNIKKVLSSKDFYFYYIAVLSTHCLYF